MFLNIQLMNEYIYIYIYIYQNNQFCKLKPAKHTVKYAKSNNGYGMFRHFDFLLNY